MAVVSSQPEVNGVDMTDIEDLTNISHMLFSLLPFASPPEVAQLACVLWVLGSTTLVLALTILFHLPPAGPVFGSCAAAYYAILGIVLLIAVPVELGTALCLRLPRHSREGYLHAFASYLLPCAHVLLLLVISMSHRICRARRALFSLFFGKVYSVLLLTADTISTWSASTSCRSSPQRVSSASCSAASSSRWCRSCARSTCSPMRRSTRSSRSTPAGPPSGSTTFTVGWRPVSTTRVEAALANGWSAPEFFSRSWLLAGGDGVENFVAGGAPEHALSLHQPHRQTGMVQNRSSQHPTAAIRRQQRYFLSRRFPVN